MEPFFPDGIPPALVRAFSCADDRANWISGRCRFRLLAYYRSIEADTRADTLEGEARHVVLGVNNTPVNFGGSIHNPVYVVSFHEADAPSLKTGRYGSFVWHTDDVEGLVRRVTRGLEGHGFESREVLSVVLLRVRYSRDTVINPEPTRDERYNLMVCQKAESDACDMEWRIVVTLSGPVRGAPEELWVSVQTRS